jgi:hypothetical protein
MQVGELTPVFALLLRGDAMIRSIQRYGGLLALSLAVGSPVSADDCTVTEGHGPVLPPLPAFPAPDQERPIDAAFSASTEPWRRYAAEIRAQALECRQEGLSRSWYRDGQRVLTEWPEHKTEVYLRDGQVHYTVQERVAGLKSWEYFEEGRPKFIEIRWQSGDRVMHYHYLPESG